MTEHTKMLLEQLAQYRDMIDDDPDGTPQGIYDTASRLRDKAFHALLQEGYADIFSLLCRAKILCFRYEDPEQQTFVELFIDATEWWEDEAVIGLRGAISPSSISLPPPTFPNL